MTAFAQPNKEDGAINMLILTDFSSTAFNALEYAVALCQQLKTSRIILYHSYAVSPMPVYSGEESLQKLKDLKNQIQDLVPENTIIDVFSDELLLSKGVNNLVKREEIELVSTTTSVNAIKIFIHQLEAKLFILNVNHSKGDYDPDVTGDFQ